jgi:putative membrane protein insertion efficiency factor
VSQAGPARAPSRGARVLLVLIRAYQAARFGHVSPCRFTPTCSEYAAEALQRHGLRRGLGLTLRRLGRCRPFGPYGADPVPE